MKKKLLTLSWTPFSGCSLADDAMSWSRFQRKTLEYLIGRHLEKQGEFGEGFGSEVTLSAFNVAESLPVDADQLRYALLSHINRQSPTSEIFSDPLKYFPVCHP